MALGGSLGRVSATGRGVFLTGARAASHVGLPLDGARVAVQGYGTVVGVAAEAFVANGARLVAAQDHTGTIMRDSDSDSDIDAQALGAYVARQGGIVGFDGADAIADPDFWNMRSEVLVPAALEGQITEQRARSLRTRLAVEGANGPTTPAADRVLHDRGILVVPDVLANAGGVIVSYFEWVQDHSSWFWTEEEIAERLDRILQRAFDDVWERHETLGVSLRTAAFVVGCSRVLQAREQRGLYP